MPRKGYRPGAGRPRKSDAGLPQLRRVLAQAAGDPARAQAAAEFLMAIINDPVAEQRQRVAAAIALLSYQEERRGPAAS